MASKSGRKAKKKVRTTTYEIGFINATTTNDWKKYIDTFKQALDPSIFNITILPPGGAKGNAQKITDTAVYFAANADLIVTSGTGPAQACKTATQANRKPFVYVAVGDPGLSALNPQTGANFTGGSNQQVTAVTQRVDYMLSKNVQDKIAVVGNYSIEPIKSAMDTAYYYLIGKTRQAVRQPIYPGDNVRDIVQHLDDEMVKTLYVCSDVYLTSEQATTLNAAANSKRMKTMFEMAELCTDHGRGDYAYGVNYEEMCEKAADYVKQILTTNAKPENLPVFTTALQAFPPGPGPAKKPTKYPKKKK